ncbi:ATP-binding protein [Fundidesulfovibrio terrae]|uniref:ATP-binding protein n=1 Tax=Fundidesulfovibrio terrae TaxID=2922866 RepID=UPI001FAE9250|nr:ATP-binding protein [Fundidesulfovibrio terrae]
MSNTNHRVQHEANTAHNSGSEPDFKAIFESAPGLFLVLDTNLRIVAVSEAYAKATMTRQEDILGKGIFDVFPDNPDDPAAEGVRNLKASLNHVLLSRKPDSMAVQKYDIRKPESEGGGFEARYWSPYNCPVLRADGSLANIIHRVEDITDFIRLKQQGVEQNRMTEELRERALQMEAEIYSRAKDVAAANTRIKQANEKITQLYEKTRELDELKSHFFANVSHELRTPLTLVLGPLSKVLAAGGLPEETARTLATARRNVNLLYRHVTDLLDVAKLEAGRMDMRYGECDLALLVRQMTSHFESFAEEMGIALTVVAPRSLSAQVDPGKCQRILINLLSNAFKFTPPGGTISVSLVTSGQFAVIRVQDNGPGVPPDMREAVFERFRQVEGDSGRRFGGTGLGLAIVKEFAEMHLGSVTVEDGPDAGALFTVSLPLTAPPGTDIQDTPALLDEILALQAVEEHQARLDSRPGWPTESASGLPLLLVVEDNPDMNAFIREALEPAYRIASAYDGREGLNMALELKPDLIISDVMMPSFSGEWMVEELRRHRELDDVPVVMLSAKADESLRMRLLRGAVQDYITKPFSCEELLARIEGLLRDRSRHQAVLRENQQRFQDTFEQAAVGIAHVSGEGRWLLVNERFRDILGYGPGEALPPIFEDITYPDDRPDGSTLFRLVLSGAERASMADIRLLRKSGDPVWTGLTVSRARDASDNPDYLICVVQDIQRRKQAEAAIRRSLKEKDLLLKEIHHRVKNNLQLISSLVYLQSEAAASPDEMDRAERLQGRIKSMALIHEQLYRAGNFSAIDMGEYIRVLAGQFSAVFRGKSGPVRIQVDAAPLRLGIDKAIPCGLMLNELITNAFKHANPSSHGWVLDISLKREDGMAVLVVQNDGMCFPEGFDIRESETLGFQLVTELARQIGGTVSTACTPGARVEVRFSGETGQSGERRRVTPEPDKP